MLHLAVIVVVIALANPSLAKQDCDAPGDSCGPNNSSVAALNTDPLLCSFGTCVCNFLFLWQQVLKTCKFVEEVEPWENTRAFRDRLQANCVAIMDYRQCVVDIYGSCNNYTYNVVNWAGSSRFGDKLCSNLYNGGFCRIGDRTFCDYNLPWLYDHLAAVCPSACENLTPSNFTLPSDKTSQISAGGSTTTQRGPTATDTKSPVSSGISKPLVSLAPVAKTETSNAFAFSLEFGIIAAIALAIVVY